MNNVDHTSHDNNIIILFNISILISQKHNVSVSLKYIFIILFPYKVVQCIVVVDKDCIDVCSLSNYKKLNRASLPVVLIVNSANSLLIISDPALFQKLSWSPRT